MFIQKVLMPSYHIWQQGKINQTGSGELTLHTRTLNNHKGTVFNQGTLTLTTDRLNNRQGIIASQGEDLHLTAHQADNTQGTVQLAMCILLA
ncbi:hypothetical protein [Photorhabdus heterorhabditis]|uniref:hypothetical protein n=1 Tax=Photorhabdus heterorhabditis TaxID=880156 RepID=UPI00165FF129